MRNKTAIELVIDDLQESVNRMRSMPTTDYISGAHDAKVRIIKLLKGLLEKEKQQIIEAWLNERDMTWINSNGEDATLEDLKPNAEEYYNSKYVNN